MGDLRRALAPQADIPMGWILVVVAAVVILTVLAALVPAPAAARIAPSTVLYST
jgi:ABC-type lipoprotein release transport system permease subunit